MRRVILATTAFLVAVALPDLAWGQDFVEPDNPLQVTSDNTSYGGVSGEFLQFGATARGMALGGAFATITDDVSALAANPAGLVFLDGPEAALTIMPYFADTDYYWTGLAFPFSDGDFAIGFQLGRFGFGNQPVTTEADPNGESGLTYGVNEVVAGLSFAHAFIDRFSAGGTVKFINDDLATGSLGGASASTVAFDFGVNFHSELGNRPIFLSFVVQNLGGGLGHSGEALFFTDVDGSTADPQVPDQRVDPPAAETRADTYPLPRLFRVGLDYDIVSTESHRVSLMSEFVEPNNTKAYFGFGGEYSWEPPDKMLGVGLRGSYTTQPDNNIDGAIKASGEGSDGIALGGGLFYRIADHYRLQFDYTYRHLGVLGSVDVFSVTLGFD
jgi:hypothetical protein